MSWVDIIVIFLGMFTGTYLAGEVRDHQREKKEKDGQDADGV